MPTLKGTRATVMGLGRFGGGLGATRYLAAQGARVLVTDLAPAEKMAEPLAVIAALIASGQVTTRLGEHRTEDFTHTDLVVANPAVPAPWSNPYLTAAAQAGVPIATEIQLLVDKLPSRDRVIAVTGSVGKSTTTAMIAAALSAAGHTTLLGGNIGGSLLEQHVPQDAWVILELSSFMLHWLGTTANPWSPAVAVCTNLAPNHLDWHQSMDHYTHSKQHILRHQRPADRAILGPTLAHWAALTPANITIVTDLLTDRLTLPGRHNRLNAAVALAAATAADPHLNRAAAIEALRVFPGLEHRLCLSHTAKDGRRFFNDSKCTTPEATLTALSALAEETGHTKNVHLITGGYDKKADLTPIGQLAPTLAGLYTIGATGPAIAAAGTRNVHQCHTLDAAVRAAAARMHPNDILLLSPACASWDQFINYEHRGEAFVRLAREVAP